MIQMIDHMVARRVGLEAGNLHGFITFLFAYFNGVVRIYVIFCLIYIIFICRFIILFYVLNFKLLII